MGSHLIGPVCRSFTLRHESRNSRNPPMQEMRRFVVEPCPARILKWISKSSDRFRCTRIEPGGPWIPAPPLHHDRPLAECAHAERLPASLAIHRGRPPDSHARLHLRSRLRIRGDFVLLLPSTSETAQRFRTALSRKGSDTSTLIVVVESPSSEANRRFVDAFSDPVKSLREPMIGSVERAPENRASSSRAGAGSSWTSRSRARRVRARASARSSLTRLHRPRRRVRRRVAGQRGRASAGATWVAAQSAETRVRRAHSRARSL